MTCIDMIPNERYGKLIAIESLGVMPYKNTRKLTICRWLCDCGNERELPLTWVRSGKFKSCGCNQHMTTHGKTHSPEHVAWGNMKARCFNENYTQYKDYGGRGIRVCDRWLRFENFYEDMGDKPDTTYQLDRIDPDGDYCLENCRWASRRTQVVNKRHNSQIQGIIREKNDEIERLKYLLTLNNISFEVGN